VKVARFRTESLVVEAVQITQENQREIGRWCDGLGIGEPPAMVLDGKGAVCVPLRDGGSIRADHGDYVVRHPDGYFYPCTLLVFEASYEPITET
jgi:hypothetical protein